MLSRIVALVLFSILIINTKASNSFKLTSQEFQIIIEFQEQADFCNFEADTLVNKTVKFKRGKAILFTLFTGFLGGHRIYFGTHHRTPVIYSVTLGGLGILPLVDLVHIIFTKDLSKFENKSQIIMWGK